MGKTQVWILYYLFYYNIQILFYYNIQFPIINWILSKSSTIGMVGVDFYNRVVSIAFRPIIFFLLFFYLFYIIHCWISYNFIVHPLHPPFFFIASIICSLYPPIFIFYFIYGNISFWKQIRMGNNVLFGKKTK